MNRLPNEPTFTCVNDGHENGNVYYSKELEISVFEDTQQGTPAYYAWSGTWDYHDKSPQSPTFTTATEAVAWVVAEDERHFAQPTPQ